MENPGSDRWWGTSVLAGEEPSTRIAPAGARVQTAPAPRRRAWPLLWLVLVAIACLAGAFFWAPFGAYWAIRSAARWDDAAALAQLVDYDQVRASLRPQLIDPVGVRAVAPAPNPFNDPLGALRNLWDHRDSVPATIRAPSPDAYLSPDGLWRVLAGRGDPRHPPAGDAPASTIKPPAPELVYFGEKRVRLLIHNPSDRRRETVLTLARQRGWFTWKLVGIGLPSAA